ncbi:hypothetical protein ACFXOL_35770, partial [Streptomyces californicus]
DPHDGEKPTGAAPTGRTGRGPPPRCAAGCGLDAARLARVLGAVPPPAARPAPLAGADAAFVGALLGHVFPEATGGGALSVSVREEAPGLLDLGAIDARTARRLVRALRF